MDKTALTARTRDHECDDLFVARWSPRAMSGEGIEDATLLELFEAARWAPSSFNGQPWRFVYAKRDTPEWTVLYGLLGEFNQAWTKNAAALVVIVSRGTFEHNNKPSRTHSFDTGSAWMSIALQGFLKGLVVHGMEGFDYDRARAELNIPQGFTVEAMCAIGHPGSIQLLPQDIAKSEVPSSRKRVSEFVFRGTWKEERRNA